MELAGRAHHRTRAHPHVRHPGRHRGPRPLGRVRTAAPSTGRGDRLGPPRARPRPVPRSDAAGPYAIAADPARGLCRFTARGTSRVGSVTPRGVVEEHALPAGGEPHGLAMGPGGAVRIALESGAIARLDPRRAGGARPVPGDLTAGRGPRPPARTPSRSPAASASATASAGPAPP
ncbi:virginiamycin B lyase family protein [Streptomyces subrutilus]|uniref:virginiamycin B lyase family protein n=1 Tax=Streptomyces subrutilus TaxID=36818 RepID=UPI003CC71B2C